MVYSVSSEPYKDDGMHLRKEKTFEPPYTVYYAT